MFMEVIVDSSVANFLLTARPGTYFETTLGRFIFLRRDKGGLGYDVVWQVLGGGWDDIETFRIMGRLQTEKSRPGTEKEMREVKESRVELMASRLEPMQH